MRHTIVVEIPDDADSSKVESGLIQHVEGWGGWPGRKSGETAKVVEYHREQMTESSDDSQSDLYGVFWAGDGYEVQSDDERKRFLGDMEAAVHVAQATDCRWLLYVEDEERWAVIACSSEDYARGEVEDVKKHHPGAEHFFYFDGRLGLDALEDGPGGIGYRLKNGES